MNWDSVKLSAQCAAVITHELDMIDPPQRKLLAIEIETAQPHVAELASSPPTMRLIVAEFIEQPHDALALH
ncbi:unnamed protein product, partial [Rotaria sp. Silwood1]